MDNETLGFAICVQKYPDYVIYIQPQEPHHVLCHYAHRGDLEACDHDSAEMRTWKQQAILQLTRKIKGGRDQLVRIACEYVHAAVERMHLMREVSGRGCYVKIKTFEEAKQEAILNPKPRPAAQVLPPPVCRRHDDVHQNAKKRKRIKDKIEKEKQNREKGSVYVWKST